MKLHPGLEWRIFHILTSKDIDDVISRFYTVGCAKIVKYRNYHSEIKFISSRRRVISSIYLLYMCEYGPLLIKTVKRKDYTKTWQGEINKTFSVKRRK